MNPPSNPPTQIVPAELEFQPGTVDAAKQWLEKIGCEAGASVVQKEVYGPAAGTVIVQAALERPDGSRVNIAIQCWADLPVPPVQTDLFPLPTTDAGAGRFRLN